MEKIGSGPAFSWKLRHSRPEAEGSAPGLVEAVQEAEAASIRIYSEVSVDAEPDQAVYPAGDRTNLAH